MKDVNVGSVMGNGNVVTYKYTKEKHTHHLENTNVDSISLGISSKLYEQLCAKLLDCSQFDSHATLQAVFVDNRLIRWQSQIREANNKEDRVKLNIATLFKLYNETEQNALILLLQVLSEQTNPQIIHHHQLVELATQLEAELKTLAK